MKICSIEDCGGKIRARGWCNMHYKRWRNNGDPRVRLKARNSAPEEAFEFFTIPEPNTGCLLWTGSVASGGYGQIWDGERLRMVHRFAYERERGPIPDGMFIDHACWERTCVNIDHLRLATPQENLQNLSGAHGDRKHDLPRGVYRNGRRYSAKVGHNGQYHYLGTFGTPEEASAVAQAKRAELFGEFAGRA